jgi:hypothetical protein
VGALPLHEPIDEEMTEMNRKEEMRTFRLLDGPRARRRRRHHRRAVAWRTATTGLQLLALASLVRRLGSRRARGLGTVLAEAYLGHEAHRRHAQRT